jgi:DNA-binding NtrC family response regulator
MKTFYLGGKMGRLLLVSADKNFIELARLSFEESFGCEVVCSSNAKSAIRELTRRTDFNVIVSEYNLQGGSGIDILKYKMSQNLLMPFFLFTDETSLDLPYCPNSFVGIFKTNQFEKLCESIELILRKKSIP